MTTIDTGSFADAAADKLPADDSVKPAPDPIKTEIEKPVVEKVVEKPAAEKPVEKPAEIEKPADDLSNPNLAGEKPADKVVAEDEDKKPVGMTDKAWVSWKAIKAEAKTAKQQATEADARVKDLQAKLDESAKTATDLESLKKELDATKQQLAAYEGEMSVTRIEGTKQFKETIKAPMAEIVKTVADLAARYEIPPDALMRAVQEPDKAKRADLLEEHLSDMKGADREELVQSTRDWHRLQRNAEEMRSDAGKRLEEMTRAEKEEFEKQTAKTTEDYRGSVTEAWNLLQNEIPVIRKVAGQDKWNAYLDGKERKIAALDVNNLPVEEVARMAVYKEAMPEVMSALKHYQSQSEKEKTRADAAEAKLRDYLKGAPGAGSGANGTGAAVKESGDGSFVGSVSESVR